MPQAYQSNQDSYDRSMLPAQQFNRRHPMPKQFPQRNNKNVNNYPTFMQQNPEANKNANLQISDADEEDSFFDQLF